MRSTQVVLVAVILAVSGRVWAADRPTAEGLLAAYQASVQKLGRVRIEGSQVESRAGISTRWTADTTVIRDAGRWKIDNVTKMTVPADATRPTPWAQTVRTLTLAGCEMIQAHELISTQLFDPTPDDPQVSGLVAFLDGHANRIWGSLGLAGVVWGRIEGDGGLPLWTIMGEDATLELLPETETIAGVETYVLVSRGKYGEHKVWLDPGSGSLPRRIEVLKQAGNLHDDEQLGSHKPPDEPADPTSKRPRPSVARRETARRIDNVQIEKKGDAFIMTGFDCESGHVSEAGEKQLGRRRTYRLRAIDVDPEPWPEGTFRFDVKIPEGKVLAVYENAALHVGAAARPGSTYEWKDGRPQRRIGR